MHTRLRYLEESKTFGGLAGLDIIDLPNKGALQGIELKLYGICGTGAADPDVWLYDRLTRVEVIVNGSEVIKSYSGEQILGMMCYKKTPLWSHDYKNMSGASCECFLYLNFGRFYHDTEYWLDLAKFNDPEIRLTYAFAATAVGGWTNGTAMTATPSRSVIPHILIDGPAESLGYIKTSELSRFTSGSAKKENMMIPRGPVYSNLYVQAWYKQQGWGIILDKLELNLNMGGDVLLRVGAHELAAANLRQYGEFVMMLQLSAKGGQAYPMPFEQGYMVNNVVGLINAQQSALDLWANYSSFSFRQSSDGVTPVTGNINCQARVAGIWPFSIAALPNFNPMDERTRLDTSRYGDVMVRVEETSSGGSNATIKLIGDEVVTR